MDLNLIEKSVSELDRLLGQNNIKVLELSERAITLEFEKKKQQYVPFIKKFVNTENLGSLILKIKNLQTEHPVLLFSEYINPEIADILKSKDIYFFDSSANVYIKGKSFLLFMKGNKKIESMSKIRKGTAFTFSEMKILFILMVYPECLEKTLREIATIANVSLGAASSTINNLINQNLIKRLSGNRIRFTDLEKIIERWVDVYISKYRKKLIFGRYSTEDSEFWKNCNISQYSALWGGEVAAFYLMHRIKPVMVTIYANKADANFLAKYKLKKDLDGDIEILNIFWSSDKKGNKGIDDTGLSRSMAPPILIYAD